MSFLCCSLKTSQQGSKEGEEGKEGCKESKTCSLMKIPMIKHAIQYTMQIAGNSVVYCSVSHLAQKHATTSLRPLRRTPQSRHTHAHREIRREGGAFTKRHKSTRSQNSIIPSQRQRLNYTRITGMSLQTQHDRYIYILMIKFWSPPAVFQGFKRAEFHWGNRSMICGGRSRESKSYSAARSNVASRHDCCSRYNKEQCKKKGEPQRYTLTISKLKVPVKCILIPLDIQGTESHLTTSCIPLNFPQICD